MRQFESAGDKLPPVNFGDELEMVIMEKALSRTRHEINSRGLRKPGECKIAVVGVGGCGNKIVDRLMSLGVSGAECVAINTDIQHLDVIHADKKILIGEKVTQGLGAGNLPYIGRNAMKESVESVDRLISGNDIVFVTAGLGGGTGTGAAPAVAELAREKGAIVIGVVTMPFRHEKNRFEHALKGLNEMRRATHTTIIIDNNKLMDLLPQMSINSTFTVADGILSNLVKSIVETIAIPSLINLDFADFRTIMSKGDIAIVGMGQSDALDRSEEASKNALNHLLLDVDYGGADGALIHISGGTDMSLGEAVRAAESVSEILDEKAMVLWGARVDPSLNNLLRVTLVLTGIRSPQLLSSYQVPETKLYNMEPFAIQEGRMGKLDLGLDLYQMESWRS